MDISPDESGICRALAEFAEVPIPSGVDFGRIYLSEQEESAVHKSMNAIVAHVGGPMAATIWPRVGSSGEVPREKRAEELSLVTGNAVREAGDNFLGMLGTPLPEPSRVPGTWREAADTLPQPDGVYAALFWDGAAKKLVVSTDFLGLQPLYWKVEATGGVYGEPDSRV